MISDNIHTFRESIFPPSLGLLFVTHKKYFLVVFRFSYLFLKPVLFVTLYEVQFFFFLISFCGTLTCTSGLDAGFDEGSSA